MISEHITMTCKEIAMLANEGKLIEDRIRRRKVWKSRNKKGYLGKLTKPDSIFAFSLVLYLNPNGIYEVVDGRQRISILLDYLKNARMEELKCVEEKKLSVKIITEATADELNDTRNAIVDMDQWNSLFNSQTDSLWMDDKEKQQSAFLSRFLF